MAPEHTPGRQHVSSPIDWEKFKFGLEFAPVMYVATYTEGDGTWARGQLVPYGPIQLMPSAQVLNYGQSVFEGMKAYRHPDGSLALFRPADNGARFAASAERLCMPPVPVEMFVEAVESVVRANADYVPPGDKGSLYLRPLLMGTGALLGLCPSPVYTFCVFGVPAGHRAKGGKLVGLRFKVEEQMHRAAPRGVGGAKAAGNYSPCLVAQATARKEGYHEVVYLDAKTDSCLEEGSGFNVFVVTKDGVVKTPEARGSILAGITRASILRLAAELGHPTQEGPIHVEEAMEAQEMFATGTAVVVSAVSSLAYQGRTAKFRCVEEGGPGPVTQQLFSALTDIQFGRAPDPCGWVHKVDVTGAVGASEFEAANGCDAHDKEMASCRLSCIDMSSISIAASCGTAGLAVGSTFADPNLQ